METALERELLDPERICERLEFHRRVIAEEEAARAICDRVLTGPSRWWSNAIRSADGGRTAGMVAVLMERSETALRHSPPEALELSEIAIAVANVIEVPRYLYDHVQKIRGQALRLQAYILSCMGELPKAARVADLSRVLLRQIPIPPLELARLDLVQSDIARRSEKYDEAIALARRAAETFLDFGSRTSWLKARNYEAGSFFSAGNPERALEIWSEMESYAGLLTAELQAIRLANMALCSGATGKPEEAARLYSLAMAEFDRLGYTVMRVKCRANVGNTLNAAGNYEDSIAVNREAAEELRALGLEEDAALAELARVEALLATGRSEDVPEICHDLIARFTGAGMTGAAMTALAFLRETVAVGNATPTSVRYIHDFLRDTNMGNARAFVPYVHASLIDMSTRMD